jgi:hypothetical protein
MYVNKQMQIITSFCSLKRTSSSKKLAIISQKVINCITYCYLQLIGRQFSDKVYDYFLQFFYSIK